MQDTCTDHFEPQRFDRVGSMGQGRLKYGAIWGKWGHTQTFVNQMTQNNLFTAINATVEKIIT